MFTKLSKAQLRRTVSYNRLLEIKELSSKVSLDPLLLNLFQAQLDEINEIYQDFKTVHNLVIGLLDDEVQFEVEDKIRQEADKAFYTIKAASLNIIKESENKHATPSSSSSTNLVKISLPVFNGEVKQWPTFIDLYNSLVHNTNLSNIEKFHYLCTSLTKDALKVITGIPLTNDNYEIAYDALYKRYQNKRFLATYYYQELYNAQSITQSKELRQLLDTFNENVAGLDNLGFPVDQWDFLLLNLLLNKLDTKTRTDFEFKYNNVEIPTYQQLNNFVDQNCRALEAVKSMSGNENKTKSVSFSNFKKSAVTNNKNSTSSFVSGTITVPPRCLSCDASHVLPKCPVFFNKTPIERFNFAKQHNLCINCLGNNHRTKSCSSKTKCRLCYAYHHTMLHFNQPDSNNSTYVSPQQEQSSESATTLSSQPINVLTNVISTRSSTVLLSTATIQILDSRGYYQQVRVLFDSGSMSNFISESCVNQLGLPRRHTSITIEGLDGAIVDRIKGITSCNIKPCERNEPLFNFDAYILKHICSKQPKVVVDVTQWSHLRGLKLADRCFAPGPIDLLIGAELLPYIFGSLKLFGGPDQPVGIDSVFGWVLQGRATDCAQNTSGLVSYHASVVPPLDLALERFWEVETISRKKPKLSAEDIQCEEKFINSIIRSSSGRFTVSLPFKHEKPNFGDTYTQALRRFQHLERRLCKNPILYSEYSEFMRDYLQSSHMSLIPPTDFVKSGAYYIPHHCVVKPDSTTTRLRVVFDASAKDSKGLSLNDTLLTGPKLQKDIFAILSNFRLHKIVFLCDIKQMYRQILVTDVHRNFQRILWRFSPKEQVQEYQLNTITYGVSSSPYCALRILQELAEQESARFPLAAEVIKTQVYIDDIITGTNDVNLALQLQEEIIQLLASGCFELRKWASNHPAVLNAVSAYTQTSVNFDVDEPSFVKVLGIIWNPTLDSFSYSYTPINRELSKRSILSDIARIYDPLGFLAPLLTFAKYLMQRLWLAKTLWDDPPPTEIVTLWNQFKSELSALSEIQIPRCVCVQNVLRLELHGFCDASQIGYGAVIYFRLQRPSGLTETHLICSKSRIAPLKTLSLPRLELCGAVLLVDLICQLRESYIQPVVIFDSIYTWSDSQVVLAWIRSSPHRWKTFVANRVSHIQENLITSSWRYVPSRENPADCVSRGMTSLELIKHNMWWHGPSWLAASSDVWPTSDIFNREDLPATVAEEIKTTLTVITDVHFIDTLLNKYSSLTKIQSIIGYINRFLLCLKKSNIKPSSNALSPLEVHNALITIVKHVQTKSFSNLFECLRNAKLLPKPFRKLSLFIDEVGLLRVGGRLRFSELNFDIKHPLLLPQIHRLTELIILHTHHKHLHSGFKSLQYLILQQFWILSPRNAIQRCLSKCVRCFRCNPTVKSPPMADLPSFRVSQLKAFSTVCIDYAGPFAVRLNRTRGAKSTKAWICVFVCCATKAIHLELASDLTSETFLAAFRRFVARRGHCSDIYSDQGTNFIGANKLLQDLSKSAAQQLFISWHFNPPGAPHFNGLAEAGVKSIKTHLRRAVGEQIFSYEEFYTFLTQIESILNSRPLCPISSDPNDLQPLTPGHFLVLETLKPTIPEPNLSTIKLNRLGRWQVIQRMNLEFWNRWHQEYLHTLQQRAKWLNPSENLDINQLVLIKNEAKAPLHWELGRVVEVHPGKDGVVRVATVKTTNGLLQRPTIKLCPLPNQTD